MLLFEIFDDTRVYNISRLVGFAFTNIKLREKISFVLIIGK